LEARSAGGLARGVAEKPPSPWVTTKGGFFASGHLRREILGRRCRRRTSSWFDAATSTSLGYGRAARSLIHERDIAEVGVRALTEDRHAGSRYVLTGPEALTQVEQVREIGTAIGRTLRWEELSREDAERELAGQVPDTALDTWAGFVEEPEVVTSTVQEVMGRPARSFAERARDHADDFR
jgi:uncharacterized protein YbjT (DUF2867 family)